MNYIRILPVGGLFHEFYNPLPNGLSTTALNLNKNELDATNLFWTHIFDTKNIERIIDKIVPLSPKYIAIVSDADTFIKQIEIAKNSVCNSDVTVKEFFCYLEIFSIVCKIYSEYVFNPHRLTIQNGFEVNNYSASQIYHDCLDNQKNPYLNFIRQYVLPQIRKSSVPVVFINGAPTFYNMAICRLIKKEFLNIHICISRHSSEYYSLNKLELYLTQNEYLFKMVDCNGVQREHNKKLNNGLPILHKVPPKRDYGRYFCIMAEKGGTSHGGLTEKLSLFFHAKKQEVNAYGR